MKQAAAMPKLWHLWLGGLIVLFLGMGVDVMEVDSAQYASIAREMLHNNQWLEVYEHGQTYQSRGYPDKPPLIFWAGAVGMWLVGENNWGFKLLATLSSLLAIWAVGRWAALLFGNKAQFPARIFYAFNAGFMLMNQDLRTDAMLVNFILLSCWQLETYFKTHSKKAFIWAFVSLALGMLAKGPVALVAVLAAFGTEALLRRDWNRLFRMEWLWGILILFAILSPMLYGLYSQWGWQKGVKYYFWTQSFGRITGENVWQNNLPATYLLENFSWAFLPWVPLFIGMLFDEIRSKFATLRGAGLAVPAFGFVLMLVAMSMSKYKLPHYVYVCWPFGAIWLAGWWSKQKTTKTWLRGHWVLGLLIALLGSFLAYWSLEWHWLLCLLPTILWIALVGLGWGTLPAQHRALMPATWALVVFGWFANGYFYPTILSYQSSSAAGKIAQLEFASLPLYYHLTGDESIHALHFYARQEAKRLPAPQEVTAKEFLLYTHPELIGTFDKQYGSVKTVSAINHFKVSHLTPAFLNVQTREQSLEKRVLLRIKVD